MACPWTRNNKPKTVPSTLLRNRWKVFRDLTEGEVSDLLKEEVVRDWLELPADVVFLVFKKLGPLLILYRAQYVCCLWRNLAKEPNLFSSIDIRNQRNLFRSFNIRYERRNSLGYQRSFFRSINIQNQLRISQGVGLMKLVHEAVKRSRGHLVEICYFDLCFNNGLRYMVDVSKSLKYLRLVCCNNVTDEEFIQVIRKAPLLEELELHECSFSEEVIKVVGKMCPQLKYFLLHCRWRYSNIDEIAFAIAENMPGLHRLCLFQNKLTNKGLQAILDGCPYLQYLHVDIDSTMRKCLGRIKHFECPTACIQDYRAYDCDYGRHITRNQNPAREYGYGNYYFRGYSGYARYRCYSSDGVESCDDFDTMKFLPAKAATCYL